MMDEPFDDALEGGKAVRILRPERVRLPLVFASPHSGRIYPQRFLAESRLGARDLRRSEDAYVDLLFEAVVPHGAALIAAEFPRAFIDPNREALELDPAMFRDALPEDANTRSNRVAAGLGTIPRQVAPGMPIYRAALSFAEAEARLAAAYRPYHAALSALIEDTLTRFGVCLVVDCHSMPSHAAGEGDGEDERPDIALGDRFGAACAPGVTTAFEAAFRAEGFAVSRNTPYAGGHTTRLHGRPRSHRHAIQIEINRGLYLDEEAVAPSAGFAALRTRIGAVIAGLAALDWPQRLGRPPAMAAE